MELRESEIGWLNVEVSDPVAGHALLQERLGLHELAVEDALSDRERPNLQLFSDSLFMAIPALASPESGDFQFVEIGIFLGLNSLITVTRQPLPLIQASYKRWTLHAHRYGNSAAFLAHAVIDGVVDEYFLAVDRLEDEVEDIASAIYRGDTTRVKDLLRVKRRILHFRRMISPIREVMNGLLRRDATVVSDQARPYFQDVYDHILRVSELLDLHRDTLASLLDVHLSNISNNLNVVMKRMTVFSTVLMSMTLVSGVYGMNFKRMPELDWTFGYPMALMLMVMIGASVLGLFRWFKWL